MTSVPFDLPEDSGSTRLRSLRLADLPRFAEYRADPLLAEYQGWEPMSLEAAEKFLHETVNATRLLPGHWIQIAVAESASDLLIGDLGLYLSEDSTIAELGFTLARAYHGKGHATRAIGLAVQKLLFAPTVAEVRAVTDQRNHASISVLTRAEFLLTSTREAVFKGKSCVELLFTRKRSKA